MTCSLKNASRVLESAEKVLDFFVTKSLGTLFILMSNYVEIYALLKFTYGWCNRS